MSEANIPETGGPMSRPDGNGLPPIEGGLTTPGGEDTPGAPQNDGDIGPDVPGMAGEG